MSATAAAEPIGRAIEIEDPTNVWLVHAIANRLTPLFARIGISPNAVSLAGMASGILAGFAYHDSPRNVGFALLGLLLMIGWHVMDGVDGQLARLTRTHSDFGKVIDGVCDYTTFGAVYAGLALTLVRQHGPWIWLLVAVAAACHAVQSAVYEMQRENYNHWGRGLGAPPSASNTGRPASRSGPGPSPLRRGADGLLRLYLLVQRFATAGGADATRRMAAALARYPERTPQFRSAYRETFAPALRRWSILSANTRTIAIFAFAAIGRPVFYFWFEIVVLGAVLALLLVRQNRRTRRFAAALETAG